MMEEKINPKKIMIFKIGAIGDVLMSTPLVRMLKKIYPKSKITYYVGSHASEVLIGNKNIDKVEVFDQNIFHKKNILGMYSLRNKIKKEKFDVAFVLDKHWAFGAFIKTCGIQVRVGFNRDGEGKYHTNTIFYRQVMHESVYYLTLLEAIGVKQTINEETTKLDLFISKKDNSFAESFFKNHKLTGKVIGIVLGGGKNPGEKIPIRRFPIEKFMELMQRLSKDNKILLLGGPGDNELHENVMKLLKNKNIANGANPSIKKSAALMKKCKVIVCSDSGPMHIASAVNNRIVSLFGPTNPKRKAPQHKESISIWKDTDIYEEDYELYGRIPKEEKKETWMKSITVNEVEDAVRKLL